VAAGTADTEAGPSFWCRRRHALLTIAPVAGLVVVPAVLWAFALKIAASNDNLATDFHHFFYAHGDAVLHGRTPAGAYPALTSVLFAPFALLPAGVADVVFTLVLVGCAAGTLWSLGVRDWRCYGAATLWYPVFSAVQTGNVSLVLALGVALLWRWRDRPRAAGSVAAMLIALKLFLWPLVFWLAVTRRGRALAVATVAGAAVSIAAWTVVGFDLAVRLPTLLGDAVRIDGHRAYTVAALVTDLGASDTVAYGISTLMGFAVVAVAVALRERQAGALSLLVGAALLLSPIVWAHYFSLLLVPVALARPRFGWLWLAPLPLWLCSPVDGAAWQKVLILGVAAAMLARAAAARAPQPAPQ
jgi:hypothetical protein